MIANADSLVSPCPKKAGAEPMPPKLPQPRTIRDTAMPLPPSGRSSTDPILVRRRGSGGRPAPCPPAGRDGALQEIEGLLRPALQLVGVCEPLEHLRQIRVLTLLEQVGGEFVELARAGDVSPLEEDAGDHGVGAGGG